MNFFDAVKSVFSQYATFSGRARRSEYWFFYLFTFLVGMVFSMGSGIMSVSQMMSGATMPDPTVTPAEIFMQSLQQSLFGNPFQIGAMIFSLAIFIPTLAVTVRRLHDIGKSGWFYFGYYLAIFFLYIIGIVLIVVGVSFSVAESNATGLTVGLIIAGLFFCLVVIGLAIWMLVLLCKDSQPGDNQYGPNPKGIGEIPSNPNF